MLSRVTLLLIFFSNAIYAEEIITVLGKSEAEELKEAPVAVDVIDTKKAGKESSTVLEVLDRNSGIRVRQTGSIGDDPLININGLQGKAIRFFRDGVPLDYLGSAFNPGIVPINILQRVEVYKGAVPVTLGSDVLGSAINYVTKKNQEDFIDTSYEYGSFERHRATLNGRVSFGKFFTVVNSFYNNVKNNYGVTVEAVNQTTGKVGERDAELFHNRFRSYFGESQFGFNNTFIADEISVTAACSKIDRENNFGNVIGSIPYGEVTSGQEAIIGSFRYLKAGIFPNTVFDIFGAMNASTTRFTDISQNIYNWDGNIVGRQVNLDRGEGGDARDATLKSIIFEHSIQYLPEALPIKTMACKLSDLLHASMASVFLAVKLPLLKA